MDLLQCFVRLLGWSWGERKDALGPEDVHIVGWVETFCIQIPTGPIRFGNRDQNGDVRKEFGCKGFSLNYRL